MTVSLTKSVTWEIEQLLYVMCIPVYLHVCVVTKCNNVGGSEPRADVWRDRNRVESRTEAAPTELKR